jgi:hypothetical protein
MVLQLCCGYYIYIYIYTLTIFLYPRNLLRFISCVPTCIVLMSGCYFLLYFKAPFCRVLCSVFTPLFPLTFLFWLSFSSMLFCSSINSLSCLKWYIVIFLYIHDIDFSSIFISMIYSKGPFTGILVCRTRMNKVKVIFHILTGEK